MLIFQLQDSLYINPYNNYRTIRTYAPILNPSIDDLDPYTSHFDLNQTPISIDIKPSFLKYAYPKITVS